MERVGRWNDYWLHVGEMQRDGLGKKKGEVKTENICIIITNNGDNDIIIQHLSAYHRIIGLEGTS